MEALLMSTHNIGFHGEIRKILTLLDWKKVFYPELWSLNRQLPTKCNEANCKKYLGNNVHEMSEPISGEKENIYFQIMPTEFYTQHIKN